MIREEKWSQYGEDGLEIEGIVIHNTESFDKTADDLFNYYDSECKDKNCTHYLVDKDKIVEVIPLNRKVYSSGKGKDYCYDHCIVITIISTINSRQYIEGQNRAIELIKDLMEEYDIPSTNIYGHIDFNKSVYCPSMILNSYGTVRNFIFQKIESEE